MTQRVKKYRDLSETRRFITVFTTIRHCPYPQPDLSSPHLTFLRSMGSGGKATGA